MPLRSFLRRTQILAYVSGNTASTLNIEPRLHASHICHVLQLTRVCRAPGGLDLWLFNVLLCSRRLPRAGPAVRALKPLYQQYCENDLVIAETGVGIDRYWAQSFSCPAYNLRAQAPTFARYLIKLGPGSVLA